MQSEQGMAIGVNWKLQTARWENSRQSNPTLKTKKEKENFEVTRHSFKQVPVFLSWSNKTSGMKNSLPRHFWKIKLEYSDGNRINDSSVAFLGILLENKPV